MDELHRYIAKWEKRYKHRVALAIRNARYRLQRKEDSILGPYWANAIRYARQHHAGNRQAQSDAVDAIFHLKLNGRVPF